MNQKLRIPGELGLLFTIIFNSLAVALMTKSDMGIASISSVPYVFSIAFPVLSFGTWNYLFQTLLVISLMILSRRIQWEYGFSFAVGIAFGRMIDLHSGWLVMLPDSVFMRSLYFIIGFFVMCIGICTANNSLMPIIPTDTFPRDLTKLLKKPYNRIKTTFDLTCLTTTLIISSFILHRLAGVGAGTVLCALFAGKTITVIQKWFDRHIKFYRFSYRVRKKMMRPIFSFYRTLR